MNMSARVSKWKELSKNRKFSIDDLEKIRQESRQREEEKLKSKRRNLLLEQVPLRFRGKTFADYKTEYESQQKIKNIMMRYVSTFEERLAESASIIFIGKPGTGKTLLSLIIYQELTKAGYTVKYESSLEFIKDILAIKFKSQGTIRRHLDEYEKPDLLILDEVTESINKNGIPSATERQLLFQIINHRYENNLCTLCISNRSTIELEYCLGNAAMDRLSENGISLAFNWESYRQKRG